MISVRTSDCFANYARWIYVSRSTTGAFNNFLENDWVGKATEATSEPISGMLADTNNFEKKHEYLIICRHERAFVLLLVDIGRVMVALLHAS